jgi:hypothetical protein
MSKLSIIVPYCNEYPQVLFTLCGLRVELEQSDIDWEIISISNTSTDKGFERVKAIQTPRIKALEYNDKLSHWNAKNYGVVHSTGDILFFIDSHCILAKDALVNAYKYYTSHYEELNGTLHLPILYLGEINGRELEYKMVCNITEDKQGLDCNPKNGPHNLHYVFTRHKHIKPHHRVSCMSTCGMMMSREIFDKLGGWPSELGIYGGGENFINFTLGVMGYHINVFYTPNVVHHYAEKRSYSWNYNDWIRNRIIASYMCGGEEWSYIYAVNAKGRRNVLESLYSDVVEKCKKHREHVLPSIIMTPQEWVRKEFASGRFMGEYC